MRTSNTTLQILSVRGLPPPPPPPPPLRTKFSLKKSYGFRGYPPSPLYGHLPNFFSLKEGSKNCVLAENTPIFRSKKVTDLGCTPLPTFTDQNFWQKKELQICEVLPPHYGQNPQISIWCPPLYGNTFDWTSFSPKSLLRIELNN